MQQLTSGFLVVKTALLLTECHTDSWLEARRRPAAKQMDKVTRRVQICSGERNGKYKCSQYLTLIFAEPNDKNWQGTVFEIVHFLIMEVVTRIYCSFSSKDIRQRGAEWLVGWLHGWGKTIAGQNERYARSPHIDNLPIARAHRPTIMRTIRSAAWCMGRYVDVHYHYVKAFLPTWLIEPQGRATCEEKI